MLIKKLRLTEDAFSASFLWSVAVSVGEIYSVQLSASWGYTVVNTFINQNHNHIFN